MGDRFDRLGVRHANVEALLRRPGIGHNNGPTFDMSWGAWVWRRAAAKAWKTPSPKSRRCGIKRAERLGITYKELTVRADGYRRQSRRRRDAAVAGRARAPRSERRNHRRAAQLASPPSWRNSAAGCSCWATSTPCPASPTPSAPSSCRSSTAPSTARSRRSAGATTVPRSARMLKANAAAAPGGVPGRRRHGPSGAGRDRRPAAHQGHR